MPSHMYVQVKCQSASGNFKKAGGKKNNESRLGFLQAAHSAAPDMKCFPTLYITMPAFITPSFVRGVDKGTES